MRRPRGELLLYGGLTLAALILRLIALGDRPFHHDESQDAYFSWVFFDRGDYEYMPILHGPLRFYLTAFVYLVLGDSDFTARLAAALMGTLMVPLPYLLRDQIGRVGALAAAVALAIGPSYLYFSRFAREDIYIASITFAMLVVVFRFLHEPRRHHPPLIAALLALSFATKESTFITCFVAGTFFLGALAHPKGRPQILGPIRAVGGEAWGWALVAFAAVFTILFTTFFQNPAGLWDGLYEGLNYWLGQHDVGRGGQPWYFYLVLLVGEEWPILLLGAVGAAVAFRRPTLLRLFLVWGFVVSLIVYSWAGEKFAWLILHPLLPLILLAGIGVQAIWEHRSRAGYALVAVGAAYAVYASFLVNAEHSADPRELLVSTQSAVDVRDVRDEVVAVVERAQRNGGPSQVIIDETDGATYPYAWYFRDLPVGYIELADAGEIPADAAVAVLTRQSKERLQPETLGLRGREYDFRVWWVPDYSKLSVGSALDWMLTREPWSPTGGLPEWLYIRN